MAESKRSRRGIGGRILLLLLGLFVCLVAVIGGIRYQEPPDRPREFKFSDLHCWLHPCSIVSAAQYTERRFVSWQYPSGTDWSWDSVEDVELGANDALAVRHSDGRVYQWIDESWYDLGNPLPRDGSSDHVYMAIGSDDSIVISDSSGKVRRSIANRQWETLLASNIVQLWSLNGDIHNGEPLEGHWNSVWSLAFSSDGEHIVSGSSDGTMILWAIGTVHTGMIRRMAGHERAVRSVAFNQDGQRIVSGSSDGTVRLWNTARGEAIGDPLEGHGDGVESVAFDLDGKRIVSGGRDGTVRLWDTERRTAIGGPLIGHEGWVESVAFGPDGKRIVSGGRDGTVRLWDAESRTAIGEPLIGHGDWVESVAFDPDGKYIISVDSDGTVRLWDAVDHAAVDEPLEGYHGSVVSVAISQDGQRIVYGSSDGTVRLWDRKSGAAVNDPAQGHRAQVLSVAFSPDGQRIVSGAHSSRITAITVGPANNVLIADYLGLRRWDPDGGWKLLELADRESIRDVRIASGPTGMIVGLTEFGLVRSKPPYEKWEELQQADLAPLHAFAVGADDSIIVLDYDGRVLRSIAPYRKWQEVTRLSMRDRGRAVSAIRADPNGAITIVDRYGKAYTNVRITPALWSWVLMVVTIGALLFIVPIFALVWRRVEPDPTVLALESDNPVDDPSRSTEAMREIATRISSFVRNPLASAPMTFALVGEWGSGKSSIMKLVERDLLNDGCPCIWFNAWHHQNEAHLFAALMESIRRHATPRSLFANAEFRLKLLMDRSREHPLAVIRFIVLIVIMFVWIGVIVSNPDTLTNIMSGSATWDDVLRNSPRLIPLAGVLWVLASRWNPLKAFDVSPASLVRASAAWVQFPRFRDRLSFRYQFGRSFGEVCKVFDDRRLVIIIDDLDRCRPTQTVEILEAVNFLTSNGECFVLLGIDEIEVKRAVDLYHRDVAEHAPKRRQPGRDAIQNEQTGNDNAQVAEDEDSYADRYLEKLINLYVKVPIVDDDDLANLRGSVRS